MANGIHNRRVADPIYRFKYFDPRRKRWIEARYSATPEEIAARYERFELIGGPWAPPDVGNTGDLPKA